MLKTDEDYNTNLYRAAIDYIRAGFYILPLRKGEKLLPKKNTGITYESATRDRGIIDLWFDPRRGQFAGCNIGIATGRRDGTFVLDVDRHGEIDGKENLLALYEKLGVEGLPDGPVQNTPTGGIHYFYKWQDNCTSSTGKICPGVDTRGGTADECKGHVVVWPSKIGNSRYEWEVSFTHDLPDVPPWIMERMGQPWRRTTGPGRGSENVGKEDGEEQISLTQLGEMLQCVDPDSLTYEQWLHIGQAINSQYPDDDGLRLWDDWSRNGERYKPNECTIRWKGFNPGGTIRMGSLYFYAMESGWKPKKGQKKPNEYDVLVEKVNAEFAVVLVGGKVKILRTGLPVADPSLDQHYQIMDRDSFKLLMQNEDYWPKNAEKPVKVANIWLAHESRRTYEAGIGLYPRTEAPEGRFNTWNGLAVDPVKGECGRFLDHIRKIICRNNPNQFEWLMDWCADAVQFPDNPKGCAVVMRGEEGAGKGTLANTMCQIFGVHGRHLIDDAHLLSNFNSHMMDAIFVFADEITWGGNVKTAGKLKGIVTERYLIGERKGIDAVTYKNMCHLMVASNESWVIPAGSKSRRWFVLNVDNSKAKDLDYFNDIVNELDNGGREAFLYELMNRKITNNLRTAMETEALQEQRQYSIYMDRCNEWWVEMVISERMPVSDTAEVDPSNPKEWPGRVIATELYNAYRQWAIDNRVGRIYPLPQWRKKVVQDFGLIPDKTFLTIPNPETAKAILQSTLNLEI